MASSAAVYSNPMSLDDPCFKLDYYKRVHPQGGGDAYWYYTIADIPENCTTFVGVICIIGKGATVLYVTGKIVRFYWVFEGPTTQGSPLSSSLSLIQFRPSVQLPITNPLY